MFEKEAKERARKLEESQTLGVYDDDESFARDLGWNEGEVVGYEEGFKEGSEFGYNKANEWNYVKDELPEKNKCVLIYTDLKNVYIAVLVEDDYFITKKWGFVQTSAVIAWKEFVFPKEIEEK